MTDWFTIDKIDGTTYIISEYRHPEETHCYLLIGSELCLLIDTGLGIGNIYEQVRKLTDKPITAIATHIHWDHIGGHKYFHDFYVHKAESEWLNGKFPLPIQAVRNMVADCDLPEDFNINDYTIFQGTPTSASTLSFAFFASFVYFFFENRKRIFSYTQLGSLPRLWFRCFPMQGHRKLP